MQRGSVLYISIGINKVCFAVHLVCCVGTEVNYVNVHHQCQGLMEAH